MSLNLVLGSASPRRKELLQPIADFSIRLADCNEDCTLSDPAQRVMYTAGLKAAAIPLYEGELLLCADTLVYCRGRFLGKPHTPAEAKEMLQFINRCPNYVYTGVCLRSQSNTEFFYALSTVVMDMTEAEIDRYILSGSPMDKAGAYGIQDEDFKGTLTQGSLSNVIGLPVELVKERLQMLGVSTKE